MLTGKTWQLCLFLNLNASAAQKPHPPKMCPLTSRRQLPTLRMKPVLSPKTQGKTSGESPYWSPDSAPYTAVGCLGWFVGLYSTECWIPRDHVPSKYISCLFVTHVAPYSARPRLQGWCCSGASLVIEVSTVCKSGGTPQGDLVGEGWCHRERGCQHKVFTCEYFPLWNSLVFIKSPDFTRRKITRVQVNMWQSGVWNWEKIRWNTREWCIGNREWKPVKNGNTWKAALETSLTTAVQETCSIHSCPYDNIWLFCIYTEVRRLWKPSRTNSVPENSINKKKKLVWTAPQIFPILCKSKQPNSDFGFVVKDNYYVTSQVVPGYPYFILIIETIFPAFFRVVILLKVGSLTSSTAWPPNNKGIRNRWGSPEAAGLGLCSCCKLQH